MILRTSEALLAALRGSGLFSPERVDSFAAALAPFGDDTNAMCRHLIEHHGVPVYQLRKVVHGKAAELFIGPYVVVDKLGEGGMGKVFKARDGRSGRVVALKVIRPHLLSNPLIRGRYGREVQTALALSHSNIAAAYEAGEDGERHYLALEFVDGVDLARLVRAHGAVSVPEACEYLRQAALGLQHAHDQGFVHRDIKPSNIVVSGERHHRAATEPALVKILDMGLVRSVGFEDGPGGPDLTRDGTVVGTPDYMAPEQAKNSSTVDHRADLYSLGAAFYFLLTAKPPFPVGTPIEKILKHQLDSPPDLRAMRPDVPADLAGVVGRLMAKKPAERYPTASDVAAALEPFTRFTAATPDRAAVLYPAVDALADIPSPPSSTSEPGVGVPISDEFGARDRTPAPASVSQLDPPGGEAVRAPRPRRVRKPLTPRPPVRSTTLRRWVLLCGILLLGILVVTGVAVLTRAALRG